MIDADTFQRILDAQRKQQEELAGQLCEKLTVISLDEQSIGKLESTIDTVQNSIPKFVYFSAYPTVPYPVNANQLRSFLEMVKFVKSLHKIRAPLDQLLPKDVKLNRTVRCEQAFKEIKNVLRSDMLLTQCDPKVDVVIAPGASNYGLGAVVSHNFLDG
ncbi:unnamed protein product [Gongylonema pulchrum]|uniref:RT_RNaseH_2 domain-containing protein n=1 Tax=Gongylonema pulchrum TaxID=637853 RepID=A0A183DX08_9BILA|nr:unnamed protein product [Gongylonema pulchrum]